MHAHVGRLLAMALMWQVCLASMIETASAQESSKSIRAEPARTAKERLGGKATDEQRVDNCKVPLDQRGAKPRPDCNDEGRTGRKR